MLCCWPAVWAYRKEQSQSSARPSTVTTKEAARRHLTSSAPLGVTVPPTKSYNVPTWLSTRTSPCLKSFSSPGQTSKYCKAIIPHLICNLFWLEWDFVSFSDLSRNEFTSLPTQLLSELPNLKEINFEQNQITAVEDKTLENNSKLERMWVYSIATYTHSINLQFFILNFSDTLGIIG